MSFTKAKCNQCGHEWFPHVERPVKCPNPACQRIDWYQPKRNKRAYVLKNPAARRVRRKMKAEVQPVQ